MADYIYLFHGTRASPESIRERGLIAGGLDRECEDPITTKYLVNKEATLQRVVAEFGLRKEDVPEWTYRGELSYEKDRPIHTHFEMSFDNACGYADMGGEPAYCIRYNIRSWLEAKRLGDEESTLHHLDPELATEVNNWAKDQNGDKCYVVIVKLDLNDPRIEQLGRDTILRVRKAIEDGKVNDTERGFWKRNAFEIRYFDDVSPKDIVGIVQVQPPRL